MPKVPINEDARDSQLLEKADWERGTITAKKGWVPKIKPSDFRPKTHHRLLISGILFLVLLIGIYVAAGRFFPNIYDHGNQDKTIIVSDVPVDVTKINYPSELNKQRFISGFDQLKEEKDSERKYLILQSNYIVLKGFYTADHNVDNRLQLEKYRDWMKAEYPQKYEANKNIFEFDCLDVLCGSKNYPEQIVSIKSKLEGINSINEVVMAQINKNFEAAVSVDSKDEQGSLYINTLAALFSEYERTKDSKIVEVYQELSEYITSNYQGVKIPDAIRI